MLKFIINNLFYLKFDINFLIYCNLIKIIQNNLIMSSWVNNKTLYMSIYNYKSVFFSRKLNYIWLKGNQSNNVQYIKKIYIDCDMDNIFFLYYKLIIFVAITIIIFVI